MSKNILILSPDTPFNGMGGLGVHLNEVLKRIDNQQFNVTVLAQGASDTEISTNVRVYNVECSTGILGSTDALVTSLMIQPHFLARFMVLYSEGQIPKPDMIHICDWSTALAGKEIARVTGAKIVFAVHLSINQTINMSPTYYSNLNTAQQIEFEVCQVADKILHVSDIYSEMFPFMIYQYKTKVVKNGVDYDAFKNADINHTMAGNKQYKILFIGRISDMKNPQALWSIKIPENVDLIFVGGEQASDKRFIQILNDIKANNPQIHYLGAKYGQEKLDIMSSADLIVMPSKHEPFGLVALEALAAGQNGRTILAASFVDGLSEFLTEESAINCGTSKDSVQIAIETFLAMTEEQKSAMRQAGCQIAQQYTWQKCANGIMDCWCETLGLDAIYSEQVSTETTEDTL